MIKNDFTFVMFVIYVVILPMLVSFNQVIKPEDIQMLLFFDCLFICDRMADLFVSYINEHGVPEPHLRCVIQNNLSSVFYIELAVTFCPFMLELERLSSIIYFVIKLPRYTRIFEMELQIDEILNYIGDSMTVFQVKKIESNLFIVQFALQTLLTVHLLTCTQIMACTHRNFD